METNKSLTLEQVARDLDYHMSVGMLSKSELLEITRDLIEQLVSNSALTTE